MNATIIRHDRFFPPNPPYPIFLVFPPLSPDSISTILQGIVLLWLYFTHFMLTLHIYTTFG